MRVIFMGTPEFSVPVLDALHARHEVVGVWSQPPRPAGRGKELRKTPVHARAEALGLSVHTPERLRDPADQAQIAALVRTLQTGPTVLLLDEPTAALDPASARAVEALLQHWFARAPERHAWVWITHDPAQATRIGHLHWRVEAGRLNTEAAS